MTPESLERAWKAKRALVALEEFANLLEVLIRSVTVGFLFDAERCRPFYLDLVLWSALKDMGELPELYKQEERE